MAVDPDRVTTDQVVEVWRENWPALLVFLDLATTWRVVGLSTAQSAALIYTGLRYREVDDMIRRHGAAPEVFWDLQVMEQAALPVLNERPE